MASIRDSLQTYEKIYEILHDQESKQKWLQTKDKLLELRKYRAPELNDDWTYLCRYLRDNFAYHPQATQISCIFTGDLYKEYIYSQYKIVVTSGTVNGTRYAVLQMFLGPQVIYHMHLYQDKIVFFNDTVVNSYPIPNSVTMTAGDRFPLVDKNVTDILYIGFYVELGNVLSNDPLIEQDCMPYYKVQIIDKKLMVKFVVDNIVNSIFQDIHMAGLTIDESIDELLKNY